MTREAELELEIARLREALEELHYACECDGSWENCGVMDDAKEALSTPPSTTALQELIEKVERKTIERCAAQAFDFWCDQIDTSVESAASEIRALPTGNLKLEDLK